MVDRVGGDVGVANASGATGRSACQAGGTLGSAGSEGDPIGPGDMPGPGDVVGPLPNESCRSMGRDAATVAVAGVPAKVDRFLTLAVSRATAPSCDPAAGVREPTSATAVGMPTAAAWSDARFTAATNAGTPAGHSNDTSTRSPAPS